MYGGKFLPLHKGHNYCIETATKECEKVYVIFFYGGADEEKALKNNTEKYLSVEERKKHVINICKNYENAIPTFIDVSKLRLPNGEEDWDAETPLVRQYVPKMDYVYSSEPGYGDYFSRAYPEATHVIVDAKRQHYPISSTMIRAMKLLEEKAKWMV